MAENLTEEQIDEKTIAEMEAALKELKERRSQKQAEEREARRLRAAEELEARVASFRENNVDEFVGPSSEWVAVSFGYSGGLEMTVHEGTTPQSGFSLSADDAQKLRRILNERLG